MRLEISAGISALKSAADLAKTIRDGLKSGQINQSEIPGRIGEIYDYIIDSKAALLDSEEKNRDLKRRIEEYDSLNEIAADLEMVQDGRYYVRRSERDQNVFVPYCPVCWGANKRLIPLPQRSPNGLYECALDKSQYTTEAYRKQLKVGKYGSHEGTLF